MLDETHELLRQGDIHVELGMDRLVAGLRQYRLASTAQEWQRFVESECLTHPVRELIHADPFTFRAYSKPRGYAGDAVMLDYIYRGGGAHLDATAARIHHYTTHGHAPRAVRFRRDLLSKRIDEVADEFVKPRILAIAAGHLREIEGTRAANAAGFDRFVAVDQDEESVALIRADYGHLGVEAVRGTVKQILSGKLNFSQFHFVYAAGLFDYLPQVIAKRLARSMLRMLAPGGRMLIANFMPAIADIGYMESYMDWRLIFRDETELCDVFSAVPRDQISDISFSRDPEKNIVFAETRRR